MRHAGLMGAFDGDQRRDARSVEIGFAVLLGVVVFAVPAVLVWVTGWALGLSEPTWVATRAAITVLAGLAGLIMLVGVLWRARRRGI